MQLQQGFSLLEVLITLLILKLGLLGVLAGQTLALQYVIDATQRTNAVALSAVLVQDLAASLNNNHPAFTLELTPASPAEVPVCSATAICSSAELRDYQLGRWQQLWQQSMTTGATAPLFDPQFCLQFADNSLQLRASWQQRANAESTTSISCEPGPGRSALALTARIP
ncbi:prepilin-type N-terminal cleavage/methylation domain-containing protein [Arsukibacterium indicum]|uniref:Prepilin-type N-terminal cleavage/methylation domain-containing protein n=1 Tax=Arsukibacterium indicum TaxID=2848612 RepID=A0ABS6MM67_9GAMM|nr:prepilin-type N-terminal cleavage/methylation domain-containing protein [Arsukibacterium indicum]MBV2129454.1 prepilin-type N-terminal cleavage/methylation domain-containing protein [Arsukibacterium indicum]